MCECHFSSRTYNPIPIFDVLMTGVRWASSEISCLVKSTAIKYKAFELTLGVMVIAITSRSTYYRYFWTHTNNLVYNLT